jgi:hypothetical protein
MKRVLLARSDDFARRQKVCRSELIARGLRMAVASEIGGFPEGCVAVPKVQRGPSSSPHPI